MPKLNIRRAAAGQQYAIVVGLIAVVAILAITSAGSSVSRLFTGVSNSLGGVVTNSAGSGSGGGSGGGGSPPPTPGGALAWGFGGQGSNGDGTSTQRNSPVNVQGVGGSGTLSDAIMIDGGQNGHACALRNGGTVVCWGANGSGQAGTPVGTNQFSPNTITLQADSSTLTGVSDIGVGVNHACALRSGGVFCWGDNVNGNQLGNNSVASNGRAVPVVGVGGVGSLGGITEVNSMGFYTCALSSAGNIYCWGNNSNGQLGRGSAGGQDHQPAAVIPVSGSGMLSNVSKIGTGVYHACAVLTDGSALCWGKNNNGQTGTGSAPSRPTAVQGIGGSGTLGGIADIDGGEDHTCALQTTGGVLCWGLNTSGQAGDGTNTSRSSPVQVLGIGGSGNLSGVTMLRLGGNATYALLSNGAALAWGMGQDGRSGLGHTGNVATPNNILGIGGSGTLTGVLAVAGGGSNAYAIKAP